MDLISFAREFGVPMALIIAFTVQGWRREKRLSLKIDALETFYRETLLTALNSSTTALGENSRVIGRVTESLLTDARAQRSLIKLLRQATQVIAENTQRMQHPA